MLMTRIGTVFITLTALIILASHANAMDDRKYKNRHDHHRQQDRSYYGGDGLPSYIRGIGTYAGGVSAIRAPRNGIYFAAEGTDRNATDTIQSPNRPRIIHVNRKTVGAECSYEAGVCVIRP
ncbi:hypothetical protein [Rhizobium skierniewicense]|uniref:hypothetical protein n=1 Tax=Rhizobium skierniewicense TaxID=984260 RepID=UPI001571D677|nr:hypothetical protein [Rhizobium skierniewicense]NTF33189.1 hypothetical protein [Rhizobium skierniewicense]